MCSCTEVLDKKYTEMYYKQGEIDERSLLPNKKSSNEMPVVDYSPKCAKACPFFTFTNNSKENSND